jgi:hypothetical protein
MRELPKDRQIYVSARLWHEIVPKVRLAPFIYALHEGIDLSKYGSGLKKFYFTFLILKPENQLHFPGVYFNKKKRSAEIAVGINYDEAVKASKCELIKMMEKAYLEGIDMIGTIRLKDDFDIEKFKEDVKAIFSVDKWYELVMEPSN